MVDFQISKTSSLPLHVQLLDELRHRIMTGVFKPHDRVPGEWELVEGLGISRATVQKAWQIAQEEGLLYRIPGKGTYIADRRDSENTRVAVGFMIPEYRSIFAMQMLSGAERVLRKHHCQLVFAHTDRHLDEEDRLLHKMSSDGVKGVILVPTRSSTADRALARLEGKTPIVLMDRPVNDLKLPCVMSNNYAGGGDAVRHLLEQGHRRILFLARPHLDLHPVAERFRAYTDCLQAANITPLPPLLLGASTEMSSYEAYMQDDQSELEPLTDMLARRDRPTAIFAVNDWMALKALRAAARVGLDVPRDLSIVGFDNLEITEYSTPPLTTVAQDGALMGAEAARRMLALLDGESKGEIITLLPTTLIVRASTRQIEE